MPDYAQTLGMAPPPPEMERGGKMKGPLGAATLPNEIAVLPTMAPSPKMKGRQGHSLGRGGGRGRALVLNGPPGSSRDSSRWPTGPPRRPIGEAGTFGPKDLCGYRFGRIRKMSSRIAAGLLDTSSMGRRAMA